MISDNFDFDNWVVDSFNEATYKIIEKAMSTLEKLEQENPVNDKSLLMSGHAFYITFLTKYKGVKLAKHIKNNFPDVMTIVLQHQFKNVKTTKIGFYLTIYLNSAEENIFIPFKAIVKFADPIINSEFVIIQNDLISIDKKSKTKNKKSKKAKIIEFKL